MALNTVTLKWDLTDLIQAGLSATLSITPTAQLSDTTDHVLIPPVARTYTFTGGSGQLAGIVANDNSAILPAGTGYLISVTAASGQVIVPQFQTQILFANGAVQWLDALAVVPVVTTSYQYLPLGPGGSYPANAAEYLDGTGHWTTPGGGGFTNPMTTLGDLIYENATPAAARLAGDTSNTRKFLRTQASGGVAQVPAWDTLQAADLPRVYAGLLTPTAVKTSAYNAAAGDYVPCDTTSAGFTVTLPNAPADLTVIGVKHVIQGGTNVVTVACSGSDVYNKTGGGTSATLTLASQGLLLQYKASGAIWYVVSDDLPLTQLDARYVLASALPLAIASGGTGQATQQAAINALTGTQSSGKVLRSDGANATLAAIQAADVPTLNQNTSGTAAGLSSTLAIGSGGTGQVTAAAAYNALSPMTTKGDIEYDSAAGVAARLAVGSANQVLGVSSGVPAWMLGMVQQAATSSSGYVLVNGTGTIITWTAPSDGNMHRFWLPFYEVVTSTETGGGLAVVFTGPDSVVRTAAIGTSGNVAGFYGAGSSGAQWQGVLLASGGTVALKQTAALTGGAATVWAEIWGS